MGPRLFLLVAGGRARLLLRRPRSEKWCELVNSPVWRAVFPCIKTTPMVCAEIGVTITLTALSVSNPVTIDSWPVPPALDHDPAGAPDNVGYPSQLGEH
jgi:hypothetical protein